MSNGSPYLLGPLGGLVQVEAAPGVGVASERPSSALITPSGRRWRQVGKRAPRSWELSFTDVTPDVLRMVELAAEGLLGDVWLYDVGAARANMLAPRDVASTDTARTVVDVDGIALRSLFAGDPGAALRADHVVEVPVRGGQPYTVSAWTTGEEGIIFNISGAALGSWYALAGEHRGATTVTPAADGILTVKVPKSFPGHVSGLRVHEGPDDGRFYPGRGTPCRVSVDDPQGTVSSIRDGEHAVGDYTVTVYEVGGTR